MTRNGRADQLDASKIGGFLLATFGLSWTAAAVFHLAGADLGSLRGQLFLVVFYMWAPAIAAIAVQRYHGAPLGSLRVRRGSRGWLVAAWLAPIALLGLTLATGLVLPGVSLTVDPAVYLADMGLPEDQIQETMERLDALPVPPIVLFLGQGLLTGVTINALAAFGEELGWRGSLLTELSAWGFWRASASIGLVWGVWHAPIILQGHNFPEAPWAGVAMMTVWTIAVSPVFTYVTVRSGSILAPTVFHGTFNAVGWIALAYLDGGGNLLVAPVGVAGTGAALVAVAACLVHDRTGDREPITTGAPLPDP